MAHPSPLQCSDASTYMRKCYKNTVGEELDVLPVPASLARTRARQLQRPSRISRARNAAEIAPRKHALAVWALCARSLSNQLESCRVVPLNSVRDK